jgi:hypothetical protein
MERISRFNLRAPSPQEVEVAQRVVHHARAIETLLEMLAPGREKSLALTKLEEMVLWMGRATSAPKGERSGS